MAMRTTNPIFMTGVPELLILRLLVRREMYGYEMVQAIEDATGSAITFGEGVVYPVLHALEKEGHLKTSRIAVNGRPRVYYAITASGKKRLGIMVSEWTRINSAVSRIVKGALNAAT